MKYVLIIILVAVLVTAAVPESAREAYLNATVHVEQMKRAGLPYQSASDLLKDMEVALNGKNATKLFETALILNQTEEGRAKAEEYFDELDAAHVQGLKPGQNFSLVVSHGERIAVVREQAFDAQERIAQMDEFIALAEVNRSQVDEKMVQVRTAFASEQFDKVPGLLNQTAVLLEDAKVAAARDRALARLARRNVQGFVEDHWISVLVFLLVVAVAVLWAFVEGRAMYALKRICMLEAELKVAQEGLLQAQKEYYAGEIGRGTYAARSDAVRERKQNATAQLQVWRELHSKYAQKTIFSRFRSA